MELPIDSNITTRTRHQMNRAIGLYSRRLAIADMGAPQPALSDDRVALMVAAAFSKSSYEHIYSASGSSSSPPPPWTNNERERALSLLRLPHDSGVSDDVLRFHVRNYEGTQARVRRGDATEYVPSVTPHASKI